MTLAEDLRRAGTQSIPAVVVRMLIDSNIKLRIIYDQHPAAPCNAG